MTAPTTPAWLTERPIAHRGLHDRSQGRPENSRAAFAAAADAGYAIELDVRLAQDGTLVVFHDAGLERLTGNAGVVAQMPAAVLTDLCLHETGETIPLLEEVLDLVGDRVPVVVEVKSESEAGPVAEKVCAAIAAHRGRVALMSFDAAVLEGARGAAPDIPVGLLFSLSGALLRTGSDWATDVVKRVERLGASFVGCDVRGLPYDPVPGLRGKVSVLGWTVTSPAAEKSARRWCDNIIFEGYQPGP